LPSRDGSPSTVPRKGLTRRERKRKKGEGGSKRPSRQIIRSFVYKKPPSEIGKTKTFQGKLRDKGVPELLSHASKNKTAKQARTQPFGEGELREGKTGWEEKKKDRVPQDRSIFYSPSEPEGKALPKGRNLIFSMTGRNWKVSPHVEGIEKIQEGGSKK